MGKDGKFVTLRAPYVLKIIENIINIYLDRLNEKL